MYKEDLALNNLQRLISPNPTNQPISFKKIFLTHRWDPNKQYTWVKVDQGVMAMK